MSLKDMNYTEFKKSHLWMTVYLRKTVLRQFVCSYTHALLYQINI